MSRTHPRHSLIVLGVAALVLTLLGAGCRNPFRKKPEDILKRAQERWVAAEGVRFNAQAAIDIDAAGKSGARERGSVSLGLVGASSGTTQDDSRADATMTVRFDLPQASGSIAIDERAIKQTAYLRLQDAEFAMKGSGALPQAQLDAIIGAVKGVIGGKWVKFDPADIQNLASQFGKSTSISAPGSEEIRSIQERFRVALRAHPLAVAREDLGDEAVGGEKTYHYRAGLNRDAIASLVEELGPVVGLKPATVAEFKTSLRDDPKVITAIEGVNVEAWVSKKGNDFRKIVIPIAFEDGGTRTSGSITVEFSDWGKPIAIEAPSDAKTIEELLGPLLGGVLGGGLGGGLAPAGTIEGTDASGLPDGVGGPLTGLEPGADADADGLTNDEEARYGSNPNLSDTDGDGFTDGEEVENEYSPTGTGRLTE